MEPAGPRVSAATHYLCGVCQRFARADQPHSCTEPHPGPSVLVLEPHENRRETAA